MKVQPKPSLLLCNYGATPVNLGSCFTLFSPPPNSHPVQFFFPFLIKNVAHPAFPSGDKVDNTVVQLELSLSYRPCPVAFLSTFFLLPSTQLNPQNCFPSLGSSLSLLRFVFLMSSKNYPQTPPPSIPQAWDSLFRNPPGPQVKVSPPLESQVS